MNPDTPIAAGSSSFDLIDRGRFFEALAQRVGDRGRIYAVDLWWEGIESLREQTARLGLANISPLIADVGRSVPLEAESVDLCLMATVLHDLVGDGTAAGALTEVRRVVKSGGRLAIVEFRKIDGPPGPPKRIRLDPGEVEDRVRPHGFQIVETREIGPYAYLSIFTKSSAS